MQNFLSILVFFFIIISYNCVQAQNNNNILPEDETKLSAIDKIFVTKFKFQGNTVFSDANLAKITKFYENRVISAEELHEVKQKLTKYYIANGYVNSGAVIPDQQVKNGVIFLKIIEGKLAATSVSGNSRLRDNYIIKRLQIATKNGKKPLNVNKLQEQLKLLKQDPRIKNINASLSPGLELGQADLDVQIKEAKPYNIRLVFNNYNSPSIGAYRGELSLSHLNLTGWGDALSFQYALTQGLDEYSINYTIPLCRYGTALSLSVDKSESVVVSSPFDILDIDSKTTTLSAQIRHPFYKTISKEFAMGLSFEKRESKTSLLGRGFPFSEGVNKNGESEISVMRFSQEWIERSLSRVIAAKSSFSLGLDMDGSTINDQGPDSKFFFWLGQLQWLKKINFLESQISLKTDLRISADPLLPMEKFEIGGFSTVRGYRENQITTDNGLITSAELRIPAGYIKIPGLSKHASDGLVQICPFIDFGYGWNTDRPDPSTDFLYSTGLGARWTVNDKIYAQIYWGWALADVNQTSEHDLQDEGIHFQISAMIL